MAEPLDTEEEQVGEVDMPSPEAMLEMIIAKEDEINKRLRRAEDDAQRLMEEAKLDAAALKREATSAEVGADIRDEELAKARAEAEKISADIEARAAEMKNGGMERIEEAVKIVIEGVMPKMD